MSRCGAREAMMVGCKPTTPYQTLPVVRSFVVKPARLHFARTARALTGRYMCERGDLSEFLAARTCTSCWIDKLVRFSHIAMGASNIEAKMLRAKGHARMVTTSYIRVSPNHINQVLTPRALHCARKGHWFRLLLNHSPARSHVTLTHPQTFTLTRTLRARRARPPEVPYLVALQPRAQHLVR